jgi:hypothetical protein
MELAVLTCFHKRAWLTELWVRHTLPHARIYAAISEGDVQNIDIAERYGLTFAVVPNTPLGRKHNAAFSLAMGDAWDAAIVLPSDDFVDPIFLAAAKRRIEKGARYVFPQVCGMYDVRTGRSFVLVQEPEVKWLKFGAGRVMAREVCEAVGPLWTDGKRIGLDTDSHSRIRSHGYVPEVVGIAPDVPCLTDVKTEENLWPFDTWAVKGRPSTPERVLGMVDVEITGAITAKR